MKTDLPNRANKTLKKFKMPSVLSGVICFNFQQTGKMRQFLAQILETSRAAGNGAKASPELIWFPEFCETTSV